jgi:predicted Rossmann fold flavoprotein
MFPTTDSSETIIQCFQKLVLQYRIQVHTSEKVTAFDPTLDTPIVTTSRARYTCQKMLLTSGSSPSIWNMMSTLGYTISAAVPSLFTFNLPKNDITQLMGLSVPMATVHIPALKLKTEGPLLITHWGLSGPAILKASAWGALGLAAVNYHTPITVDWTPTTKEEEIKAFRDSLAKKKVIAHCPIGLPSRLWQYLVSISLSNQDKQWADLTKDEMNLIVRHIKNCPFDVKDKTTFKEEFVTAGGVDLKQVDFTRFKSKLHDNLYFAGEVLDIDGVTGGFNFQAAWTGSYLAAEDIAKSLDAKVSVSLAP